MSIDPSIFSIGIWNNLETSYTAKKVVQSDLTLHPTSSNLNLTIPFAISILVRAPCFNCTNTHLQIVPKPAVVFSVVIFLEPTFLGIVQHHPMLMEPCAIHHGMNKPVQDTASPVNNAVTHGMAPPGVTASHAVAVNTGALCADPSHLLPNNAISSPNLLIINTPFIANEWESALSNISPFNQFSNVSISIHLGFNMGVSLPPSYTYTPPNYNSALLFPDDVLSVTTSNNYQIVACTHVWYWANYQLSTVIYWVLGSV